VRFAASSGREGRPHEPSGLVSSFGAAGFGSATTIAARRGQRGDIVTLKPHVPPHLEADVIRFGYDEAVRAAALRDADEGGGAGELYLASLAANAMRARLVGAYLAAVRQGLVALEREGEGGAPEKRRNPASSRGSPGTLLRGSGLPKACFPIPQNPSTKNDPRRTPRIRSRSLPR